MLLTAKPVLYVCNVAESDVLNGNSYTTSFGESIQGEGADYIVICAGIEADIAELDEPEDRKIFLEDLGLDEPGLHKVIRAGYKLLNLITYFTAGEKEVRAWTVRKGSSAPQAAGCDPFGF